jgi:tetratricopeptide (TPR) repeat protein
MIRFGPIVALALFVAAPFGASYVCAEEGARPPALRPPATPLPPRGHSLDAQGNGAPATELGLSPPPQTAKPDVSESDKTAPPAAPHSRGETLNDLYARLAASKDAVETAGLLAAIDRLGLDSGSDAGDLLMARAIGAMGAKKYDIALTLLDKLVDLQPDWAEAWNKRATVRFLVDDDQGSMADIAHVLKIEPRHVGALSGMGMILERRGFRDDALRAYRRALAIAPQLDSLKSNVDRLTKAVQGQSL